MDTTGLSSLVLDWVHNYQESAGRLLLFELMGSNTGFSSINISKRKVSETTIFIIEGGGDGGGGDGAAGGGGGGGGGGGHIVTG